MAADAIDHHGCRQNLLHGPAVAIAHIHVFDQTQLQPLLTRQHRQRNQLIVVHAALDHRIELQSPNSRVKSGRTSSLESRQHLLNQTVSSRFPTAQASHARHHLTLDRIKTDGDPFEASCTKSTGPFLRQQDSVAGECHLPQTLQRISGSGTPQGNLLQQRKQPIAQ